MGDILDLFAGQILALLLAERSDLLDAGAFAVAEREGGMPELAFLGVGLVGLGVGRGIGGGVGVRLALEPTVAGGGRERVGAGGVVEDGEDEGVVEADWSAVSAVVRVDTAKRLPSCSEASSPATSSSKSGRAVAPVRKLASAAQYCLPCSAPRSSARRCLIPSVSARTFAAGG